MRAERGIEDVGGEDGRVAGEGLPELLSRGGHWGTSAGV